MTTGKYYNLTQNWPGMTVWLTPWQSPWLTKIVMMFGQFGTFLMFWRDADKPFSVKWLCFLINLSLTPQQNNFCVFLFHSCVVDCFWDTADIMEALMLLLLYIWKKHVVVSCTMYIQNIAQLSFKYLHHRYINIHLQVTIKTKKRKNTVHASQF